MNPTQTLFPYRTVVRSLGLIAPGSSGKTAAGERGKAGMLLFGIDQPRPLDPQSTFGIAYGGGIGCRVDAKQGGACRHCRAFFEKTAFENAGNTGVDVHFALAHCWNFSLPSALQMAGKASCSPMSRLREIGRANV